MGDGVIHPLRITGIDSTPFVPPGVLLSSSNSLNLNDVFWESRNDVPHKFNLTSGTRRVLLACQVVLDAFDTISFTTVRLFDTPLSVYLVFQ